MTKVPTFKHGHLGHLASRAVQASLLPELAPDRPVGPLVGSVVTGSNADLIATVAPLYLTRGPVVDVTYGRGGWWERFRPDDLVAHDLAVDGVDFGNLPEPDDYAAAVCFDPPYEPAGGARTSGRTRDEADFRDRYGLEPRSRAEVVALFNRGMPECARVVQPGGFVLAKCEDYTSGGRFHLGHLDMIDAATSAGLAVWDRVIHHTGPGMGGHNIFTPIRTRKTHSYLLVFTNER